MDAEAQKLPALDAADPFIDSIADVTAALGLPISHELKRALLAIYNGLRAACLELLAAGGPSAVFAVAAKLEGGRRTVALRPAPARRETAKPVATLVHLDREFFQPNFVKPDPKGWFERTKAIASSEQWVMDGSYLDTIDFRLERADAIVWVDLPRWRCLVRLFLRTARNYGQQRDDVADGCVDRFRLRNFVRANQCHSHKRDIMRKVIWRADQSSKTVIVLSTPREVNAFVTSLRSARVVGIARRAA